MAGGNSLGKAGSYPLGYYYFKGAGEKKKLLPDKENIGNVWVSKIQGIEVQAKKRNTSLRSRRLGKQREISRTREGGKGKKHTQGLMTTRRVDLSSGLKVSELKGKLAKLGLSFLLKAPETYSGND